MADIATLAIKVDATQAKSASADLDKLSASGQRAEVSVSNFSRAASSAHMSTAAYSNAMRMVPMQVTDIATSLASGMPAYMVAIQQGGQLRDSFGSIGAAAKGVASYLVGLVNPLTIAATAVAAGAGVWYMYGEKAKEAGKKAADAASEAAKAADKAWAGVDVAIPAQITSLEQKILGAQGQLDAALQKRGKVTRETSSEIAMSIGLEVQSRRREIEGYRTQINQLREDQKRLNEISANKGNRGKKEGGSVAANKPMTDEERAYQANERFIAQLKRERDTYGMTAAEIAVYDAEKAKATESQIKEIRVIAEEIDAREKRDKSAADLIEQQKKRDEEAVASQKKAQEEMQRNWEQFTGNVQRNLGDVLYNGLNGGFKNIGDAFKQMTLRMAADAAAARLTQALFGEVAGSGLLGDFGKTIGGWFGKSFAGGGFTGNGARSGGVDGMGGFPAILHPNETVIDHTRGQSAAQPSVTVVQNINIDSRSDQAVIMGAMQRAAQMAENSIMNSLQRGGQFAKAVGRA